MIVNKSLYPLKNSFGLISQMQDRFAKLQTQLGTGEKYAKLSEMGRDLPVSLSVRSTLNKLEGYSANIDTVNLRLTFLDQTLTRFDKMEGEARNAAVPGQYGTNGISMATIPGLSAARFDEIVDLLNDDVAGRYLFGGNITDKPPLATSDALLNGASGKGGYKDVLALRRAADGVDDMAEPGRLQTAIAGTTVSLTEDGDHPFGFKLSTISSTASTNAVVVTQPGGTAPQTLSVDFAAQPSSGDSISIGLKLPDGTETQIKLTATTTSPAPAGQFTIGADADETAANFQTALNASLGTSAKTELRAASTYAAANDFFNESGTAQIPVIAPGDTKATSLQANSTEYVQWYTGSQVPTGENPRNLVLTSVDDSTKVSYGMQANESGFLRLIRSQAAMAVSTYPSETQVRADLEGVRTAAMTQPEGIARDQALAAYEAQFQAQYRLSTGFFDGMATRQQSAMSEVHNSEAGSIEIMTMDIGLAKKSLQNATERHTSYSSQLESLLTDVEGINNEQTAMEILALQTRLTASYQTTSMLSQLSLVNFLR